MRLTHLRLAGFKSFVEPTSVAIPSNLVGVVGPNGCGKSNIIDAVRWVLGESKASELRGESMQDVIFNGSTNRKPASRASVELVFDNAEGKVTGGWNRFAEISVKRVLTRDGSSTYYINQQPVRRRDVQDMFMGTGLGPRAYAIIGQGMISRIIEARPEELRVFLEEAAGVSKYKERRRETGNRLQDTRDNLTRVEDILRELSGQIEKLEKQAEVARRFKSLEEEKSDKQQLLWAMRLSDASTQRDRSVAKQAQIQAELEAVNATSVQTQTELLALRQHQSTSQQALEAKQADWIEMNRIVSNLEADLRVMKESKERLVRRIQELQQEKESWAERAQTAAARVQDHEAQIGTAQEHHEACEAVFEESELALAPVQQSLSQARTGLDEHNRRVLEVQRQASQFRAQLDSANRAKQAVQSKLERVSSELGQWSRPSEQELERAQRQQQDLQMQLAEQVDHASMQQGLLQALEGRLQAAQSHFNAERDKKAQVQAKLNALAGLESQLTQDADTTNWLKQVGLDQGDRLMGAIEVERGWERAIETALRESLDSLVVDQLEEAVSGLNNAEPPTRLALIERSPALPKAHAGPDAIVNVVACSIPELQAAVSQLLGGFIMADSLEQAVRARGQLLEGQRYLVKAGHMVSAAGVHLYAADSEQAGRLERQQQISALNTELKALSLLVTESEQKRNSLQAQLDQAKQDVKGAQVKYQTLTRQAHEIQLQVLRLEEAQSRADARADQLSLDKALLESELEENVSLVDEAEGRLENLELQLDSANEALQAERNTIATLERDLASKQEAFELTRRNFQDSQFNCRTLGAGLSEANRDSSLADQEANKASTRIQEAQGELGTLVSEEAEQKLQDALAQRVVAEEEVSVARETLEALMAKASALEKAERESEKSAEPLRESLQELALKIQATEMNIEQYTAQLQEACANLTALNQRLLETENLPSVSALQSEVTRMTNAMQALGAVNLAALDELSAASDRKIYLDQQANDLTEASNTLEDAIRKIDMETRSLLSSTFEAVNSQFSRLFPLLFGGGEARLVMTGDEVLDAGVQVFAQPPGKRNGTIHLLSGGEKALTATALVFAIFELNPAPFCLLDEVDAPLDDANTDRFTRLVCKMAERTQFLFISHNKIAMEMAKQLIGVTMQEKGVSRIVAVDLNSAEKLATETA